MLIFNKRFIYKNKLIGNKKENVFEIYFIIKINLKVVC